MTYYFVDGVKMSVVRGGIGTLSNVDRLDPFLVLKAETAFNTAKLSTEVLAFYVAYYVKILDLFDFGGSIGESTSVMVIYNLF